MRNTVICKNLTSLKKIFSYNKKWLTKPYYIYKDAKIPIIFNDPILITIKNLVYRKPNAKKCISKQDFKSSFSLFK